MTLEGYMAWLWKYGIGCLFVEKLFVGDVTRSCYYWASPEVTVGLYRQGVNDNEKIQ